MNISLQKSLHPGVEKRPESLDVLSFVFLCEQQTRETDPPRKTNAQQEQAFLEYGSSNDRHDDESGAVVEVPLTD